MNEEFIFIVIFTYFPLFFFIISWITKFALCLERMIDAIYFGINKIFLYYYF